MFSSGKDLIEAANACTTVSCSGILCRAHMRHCACVLTMLRPVHTLCYTPIVIMQDAFVIQQGLRALFGLTLATDDSNDINSSDAAMTVLAQSGACEVVVSCLQSFHKDSDVTAWSCRACFALAGRCSITRARLANAGVCKAIVKVMAEHCKDREVTEEGCAAIQSLSADADTRAFLKVCCVLDITLHSAVFR
jgi:hypothetical protein